MYQWMSGAGYPLTALQLTLVSMPSCVDRLVWSFEHYLAGLDKEIQYIVMCKAFIRVKCPLKYRSSFMYILFSYTAMRDPRVIAINVRFPSQS